MFMILYPVVWLILTIIALLVGGFGYALSAIILGFIILLLIGLMFYSGEN